MNPEVKHEDRVINSSISFLVRQEIARAFQKYANLGLFTQSGNTECEYKTVALGGIWNVFVIKVTKRVRTCQNRKTQCYNNDSAILFYSFIRQN